MNKGFDKYDNLIEWCKMNIEIEKRDPYGLSGKRLEGYEIAMKAVMSRLHTMKENTDDTTKQ